MAFLTILQVFTYDGVKKLTDHETQEFVKSLSNYDVVLTTYTVLSAEIHFAQAAPTRNLRNKQVYKPKRSPLVEISWWRVCLDEAQMIESGVGNSAIVAREIPRVNAWCVTGTPVRKEIDDLNGLLLFLRYDPFCRKLDVWKMLVEYNHSAFKTLFNYLALRHSKDIVRDEISLPPQHRVVVTVPFSQVEEQYYQNMFGQMCEDLKVDSNGNPINPNIDRSEISVEKMRTWLVR